jgi:predicted HTH transcriptional regulator
MEINTSAIQKHIDKLKEKGIIKREGADRGGKWIISE